MEGLLHPFYLNQFKFVFGAQGYRESFCSKTYIKAFEPRMNFFTHRQNIKMKANHVQCHPLLFTNRNINIMAKKNLEDAMLKNAFLRAKVDI